MNENRWSPRPVEEYVRTVEGKPLGPGSNKALIANPAAWNLYWLTFPFLESHTDLDAGTSAIVADPLVVPVLETVNQFAGASRVGDLAAHLTPSNFVDQMERRDVESLAIVKIFTRDLWIQSMRSRVEIFLGARRGDLNFDLTPQKNGTKSAASTNILPLVQLMSKLLH